MKKSLSIGIVAVSAMVLASSCGKLPQAEIDQAKSAIDSAMIAGAEIYVPAEYAKLQDSLNAAMILVEAEGSKMIKGYGAAREKLNGVTGYAREVLMLTENRKAELKQEIRTILADTRSLLDKNRELISQAPKGKEGTAALQAIKAELATIESSVAQLELQVETGDLLACQSGAVASREKAASINKELSEVIAKYNKARR